MTAVPFLGVLVVAASTCAATAVLVWQRGSGTGTRAYVALMASVVFWTALVAASVVVDGFRASLLPQQVVFFATATTAVAWFVFVAEYAGYGGYLTRPRLAALAAEPLVVLGLTLTNDSHRLMYIRAVRAREATDVEFVIGVGFWIHALFAYVLLVVGVAMLAVVVYRRQHLYRSQVAALVVAVVTPAGFNVASLTGVTQLDGTSVGFAVSGLALFFAVYRFQFMDLTPVARSSVFEDVEGGVVVVDDENRITDCNAAARELLDLDDAVGRRAPEALSDGPVAWERLADLRDASEELPVESGSGRRTYSVRSSPLSDAADRRVGRAFVVHDVTEQHRRRQELERQNEQLERFASVVSHDLRNPLAVSQSYLELARDADDPGDAYDTIGESLDRMEAIISDVLTLAREGRTVTETRPVAVPDVAREAWRNVDTGSATLNVDSGLEARIVADRDRLLHVFENLFRNSVEHGSTGSRPEADDAVEGSGSDRAVEVRVGPTGSDGETVGDAGAPRGFYVADDGPGIPEEHRDEVLEEGFTTSDDGTGLGLAIVRSVVESHGWTISVGESAEGGARFEVTGVSLAGDDAGGPPVSTARSPS